MNGPDLLAPVLFYQNPVDALQSYNGSTNQYGVPTELFSCRGCNKNLAGGDPASQYQRQKLIQKTVRVYASLYTANLGALSAYRRPLAKFQTVEQAGASYIVPPGVNWNQMSDRHSPSVQHVKTGSGSSYGASSTKRTIVRNRPGAMSPGGTGVDIKHNSYDRYLNRLKGRAPIRRGIIPPDYGAPIPFNRAYPIYGGKIVKTAIVNNCDCPDITSAINVRENNAIYASPLNDLQDQILSVKFEFHVGDTVWVSKEINDINIYEGRIQSIANNLYTVQIVIDNSIVIVPKNHLMIYYQCNCSYNGSIQEVVLGQQFANGNSPEYFNALNTFYCNALNKLAASQIL